MKHLSYSNLTANNSTVKNQITLSHNIKVKRITGRIFHAAALAGSWYVQVAIGHISSYSAGNEHFWGKSDLSEAAAKWYDINEDLKEGVELMDGKVTVLAKNSNAVASHIDIHLWGD